MNKICIIGASGKLGVYMVKHALARDYEVVGVCRKKSVDKLDEFKDRITIVPGATNDRMGLRKLWKAAMGFLPCWFHGAITNTPLELPKPFSTLQKKERAWCFLVDGTFRKMGKTCIQHPLKESSEWPLGSGSSFVW